MEIVVAEVISPKRSITAASAVRHPATA